MKKLHPYHPLKRPEEPEQNRYNGELVSFVFLLLIAVMLTAIFLRFSGLNGNKFFDVFPFGLAASMLLGFLIYH